MNLLAVEFSSNRRSLAALENGEVVAELVHEGSRGPAPLALVEELLRQASWRPADVRAFAIGLGPGSHTGIRSAILLAQGWQAARGTSSKGVHGFEAMAWRAWWEGWRGGLHLVVDAQKQQVYHAAYALTDSGFTEVSKIAIVDPPSILLREGEKVAGPEVERWFPDGERLHPEARHIGKLAGGDGFAASAQSLEPVHLRGDSFVKALPPRIL